MRRLRRAWGGATSQRGIATADRHRVGAEGAKEWKISRFWHVVWQVLHRRRLQEVFDTMIRRLGWVAQDLSRHLAGDASSLHARRAAGTAAEAAAGEGLPEPTVGRKEYSDEAGKVTKVFEWFGYKRYLLVWTELRRPGAISCLPMG